MSLNGSRFLIFTNISLYHQPPSNFKLC